MAVDFFEKSPTYKAHVSPEIFRRRQVIAGFLKKNYTTGQNNDNSIYQQAFAVLEQEHIRLTRSTYQSDKGTFRYAYLYLTATTEDEKANILRKAGMLAPAIRWLAEDNLRAWSDLGYDATTESVPTPITPEPVREPEPSPVRSEMPILSINIADDARISLASLAERLEELIAENDRLQRDAAEIERLRKQHEDDEEYIKLVDDLLATAERTVKELLETTRHAASTAHAETLEQIAEHHPEFPKLTEIAQQMRAKDAMKTDTRQTLLQHLPSTFTWPNETGSIHYEPLFLEALDALPTTDKARVICQIELLATQGSKYASLDTRKTVTRIPHSPPVCFVSRGTDELRFSWHKNGGILIHWMYRKGDSRVRCTER